MKSKDVITAVGLDHRSRTVGAKSQVSVARRLRIFFWCLAVVLGAVHAWHDRHVMFADGIAYLDIADAYARGDWKMAINAYWSPLYSWLLAVGMLVFQPSAYWEGSVVHLVNFLIYLCALGSFHFFLAELISYTRERAARYSGEPIVSLPEWALLALGYLLFIYSCLDLITIKIVSPDLLVAAFVYLAAGILVRISRGFDAPLTFGLLGVVLGFGYLAKAPMLPLAFVFIGVSLFLVANLWKAVPRVLITLGFFFAIISPFIMVLSKAKGRLSFADAAILNYASTVAGRKTQLPPPANNTKIFEFPAIYSLATESPATHPRWFDPSSAYGGLEPRLDIGKQLEALFYNAEAYYSLFFYSQGGLVVGLLILYLFGLKRSSDLKHLAAYGNVLIPAIAGLGMYALIIVKSRYIGAFVALLLMGVASAVRLPDSRESRRLMSCVAIAMLTILAVKITADSGPSVYFAALDMIRGVDASSNTDNTEWRVADALNRLGLRKGDKVAVIGNSVDVYWARLARVQLIAEIRKRDRFHFWAADPQVKSQVIETLANTGAKMIVADTVPNYFSTSGWQKIENTGYYVYLLSK